MINRAICSTLFVLAFIVPAAAQTPGITFPKSLVITSHALQAATQAPSQPPSTGAAAPASGGPRVALTVADALKLALDHNLDISVQRFNQDTYDISLASIRSVYRPTVTSTVSAQSQKTAPTNTTAGGVTTINSGTTNFNAGLGQQVPWHGGSLLVNLNNARQTTTSLTATVNPLYNSTWFAQYTQPVLRNFTIDSTRQQLVVTKLNQDISDLQLQQTISNTQANVQNAYWDYVFAIKSVEVAQQSLSLAEELVRNNQSKVEIGTLAPIDVVQSQTQAAAARQLLVNAQGAVRTGEIALKRLIVNGTSDPLWTSTIDPTDRPSFAPRAIDVNAAIQRALTSRTDVLEAKKSLQVNAVTLDYLEDQTKPQADLIGRYQTSGVGGTRFIIDNNGGINRVVTGTVPGGYFDALSTLFQSKLPTWSAQINFSYPLGMSSQRAAVARAKVQQNQIDAQLRQIDLAVASDVSNAVVAVQNGNERVQAAQAARELAQQQLDAENSKFAVGMSTNFLIVQAQRDLATAQNNELQSILIQQKALVEFERVQQTGNGGSITIIGR